MPTELDKRLERYLDAQDAAERNGATIGAVKTSLEHVVNWTQAHEKKDDTRHDESSKRLEALEKVVATGSVLVDTRLKAMESDIRELKGVTRGSMDSIHDLTEQQLEEKLAEEKARTAEEKAKNKETVDFWKKVLLATITSMIALGLAYLAGRAGLAAHSRSSNGHVDSRYVGNVLHGHHRSDPQRRPA